ncbi:hypothetical protein ABZU94_10460 [Streptomyces mirabilis]|uniref:hypothetical protein n=1 Tax=Streptomyces sp. NPDC005388 TaxID=3156717 RepID=UPI0033A30E38
MAPPLDLLTVQRLAYVRYLYREGIEQSRQPAPLRSRAITSFHDAVENYVGLVAQHLGAELKKNSDFLQYWDSVSPYFLLPKREQMKRMNDARVALKHNGTFPSAHQIEQAREALADFFSTVTPKVFGVDFDSIDMADLLTQPEVIRLAREAQTHADIGDYPMAMAGLVLAFEALLQHYAKDEGSGYASPFRFGPRMFAMDEPKVQGRAAQANARLLKLTEFMDTAQDALRVISLGVDYPSLARFAVLAPRMHGYANGGMRFADLPSVRALTADDYEWGRHFVIESGLRAARADEIRGLQERAYELNRSLPGRHEERSWTGPAEAASDEA